MTLVEALIGALALGIIYGIVGWGAKRDPDEPFKIKKFLRSIFMYVAAAVILFAAGESISQSTLMEQVAGSAYLGTLFDFIWSKLQKEGIIPTFFT